MRWLVIVGLAMMPGCWSTTDIGPMQVDTDVNTDNPTDADADADSDSVSPWDTDSGADADADIDGDVDDNPDAYITADAEGWIDAATNPWGIQGSWFSYDDGVSTIIGSPSGTGGWCAAGIAEMADESWSIWGAGIGFYLCLSDLGAGGRLYTLRNCPLDLSNIIGFRLTLTGSLPRSELRVTMGETYRDESAYITATGTDVPMDYLFTDAEVGYDPSADPADPTNVERLQFLIATSQSFAAPFDFCIESIQAITE